MSGDPKTRQGGREPAPEEHDRPEQKKGYDRQADDAAVEVRRRERSSG